MAQDRFESKELHPRVAALLQKDAWLYCHECQFSDKSRADFIALNPRSGHVAVVECKVYISSISELVLQLNHYHGRCGIPEAFKWVFVWKTPLKRTVEALMGYDIQVYDMDSESAVLPIDASVGHKSKRLFREAFEIFYPDFYQGWMG